jgi:hypothetical protein
MKGTPATNRRNEQAFAVFDRVGDITPNCSLTTQSSMTAAKYNGTFKWMREKSGLSEPALRSLPRWSVGKGAKEHARITARGKTNADLRHASEGARKDKGEAAMRKRAVKDEKLRH